MTASRNPCKVAFIGDYPPRRCGIATFTHDLREAVKSARPDWPCTVVAVTDPKRSYDYPAEVRFEIAEVEVESYVRAADFLNLAHADVLCVQHEFGIFGGVAGSHLIALLRRARKPLVTTLHTVLSDPTAEQRRVFDQVLACSTRLVVMAEKGAQLLREVYRVADEKIVIIPHGIPDLPFADPNFYKDQFAAEGRPVLLTFGLLSPGKGIEYAIDALPSIAADFPEVLYIVLGATHPNLLRSEGETYRLSLERRARALGVEHNIDFINHYVASDELGEFIGATDIYLNPYLNEAQITSGTLAYCFGAGKAVVSTPYWHAKELLADGRGCLVPFRDAEAIASAVKHLLHDESARHAMRKSAYLLGREMVWPQVGHAYARVFDVARQAFRVSSFQKDDSAAFSNGRAALPSWRFDHLLAMTDSTGIFQHAVHALPRFEHGYCTDDNARALLLTVMLEELDEDPPELHRVQTATAAFLDYAFCEDLGRFRNFMSFDRKWLESMGSEDSHGRALWALGAVVGRTRRAGMRAWAAALFERALPATDSFTSPRSWAFTIFGLHDYLRVLDGDLMAQRLRIELSERLLQLFRQGTEDWPWGEDVLSYDNARLPHALLLSGRWTSHDEMKQTGLRALRWLMDHQTSSEKIFCPVGSDGFWHRGREKARFDQQPLEATACVSACIEAFNATGDRAWKKDSRRAFDWFLGANDLRLSLYDPTTGGCFDGMHPNRVNQNQGAESTLSYLLALAEMRLQQNTEVSFGSDAVVVPAQPGPPHV